MRALRMLPALLVAAASTPTPAVADLFANVVFDTATAPVQQGLLANGPNQSCDQNGFSATYPAGFVFRNNDPGEDHFYKAYELYNNGPERCVQVKLDWSGENCDFEIGLALYLGSFDPAHPEQNLIAHSWEGPFHSHAGHQYNDYRHSPGYYRDLFQAFYLDTIYANAVVPAYAKVIVVLNTTYGPGQPDLVCPRPGRSFNMYTENLDDIAPEITVTDGESFEYGPTGPEGGILEFGVHLSLKSVVPVSVDYATSNGSAIAGTDYQAVSDTLTFQPGETFKYVPVQLIGNAVLQSDRTFDFTLSNSSPPGFVIADAEATGTIKDDDSLVGTCHIADPASLPPAIAGEPYGPVELIADAEVVGDWEWSLVDPSCLPPDLTLTEGANQHGVIQGTPTVSGTFQCTIHLVCPASDSSTETKDIPITLVVEPEGPQVFLSVSSAAILEGDAGTTPVLPTIHIDPPASESFTLEVVLLDGSALAAEPDYESLPPGQQIGINAGESEVPIPLGVFGDLAVEGDETFVVELRMPVTQEIVDVGQVTIINDDEPTTVVAVPTLAEWGLLALIGALGGLGAATLARMRG